MASLLTRVTSLGTLTLLISAGGTPARAQSTRTASIPESAGLPLAVENVITQKGATLFDISVAYANTDMASLTFGEPLLIPTGPTSFIRLPPPAGPLEQNSDTLVGSIGLRHGVARRTELFARASAVHTESRGSSFGQRFGSSSTRFADLWAGVSHQFADDATGPAIIGFAELAALERGRFDTRAARSGLVGVTVYKAFDPIVLAASTAYRLSVARRDGLDDYDPGEVLTIRPTVGFAANERINLTTGFQWTRATSDIRNGQAVSFDRTSTDVVLGAGYGLPGNSSINLTLQLNASGRSGADLRLNWLQPL